MKKKNDTGKRRLMSEYKKMQKKSPTGIAATPFAGKLNIWQACIFGPDETLWEGGTFFLRYVSFYLYFSLHLNDS